MKMKVDTRAIESMLNNNKTLADKVLKSAYKYFVASTPIRTGNARSHTTLSGNTIEASYPYAQRLDDGYSKQSPEGMTNPTEQFIQDEVNRQLKGK
jgi:hypothetical protein